MTTIESLTEEQLRSMHHRLRMRVEGEGGALGDYSPDNLEYKLWKAFIPNNPQGLEKAIFEALEDRGVKLPAPIIFSNLK